MVRLIIGLKGTGKTKTLIDLANKAVETSPGHVACIEKGNKLIFDVKHQVRLIDTEEYDIDGAEMLYGLVCGIMSANYDIKDIFIDSSLKICDNDIEAFKALVDKLDKLTAKAEINLVTTCSIAPEDLPAELSKYIY